MVPRRLRNMKKLWLNSKRKEPRESPHGKRKKRRNLKANSKKCEKSWSLGEPLRASLLSLKAKIRICVCNTSLCNSCARCSKAPTRSSHCALWHA